MIRHPLLTVGAVLLSLACGGGGGESGAEGGGTTPLCSEYVVSYTFDPFSTSYRLTGGFAEAGGVPHGNPNAYGTGALELFASAGRCTMVEEDSCDGDTVLLTPDPDEQEAIILGFSDFPYPYFGPITVAVTAMDDEAVKGTFTSEYVTGEFCVARNDELVLY